MMDVYMIAVFILLAVLTVGLMKWSSSVISEGSDKR